MLKNEVVAKDEHGRPWSDSAIAKLCRVDHKTVAKYRAHPQLRSSMLEITPEMAARWLEGNVRNRKVDQKHVDRLILHNRFVIEQGQAVSGKDASFDHVIRGNVFAIDQPVGAPIWLATPDCIGWRIEDNAFYGVGRPLIGGSGRGETRGNRTYNHFEEAPRPSPDVPSIYHWQRERKPLDRQGVGE